MFKRRPPEGDLAALVDHMFAEVMTPEERTELLEWVMRWEDENPGLDQARRVTGWIDVAYAFQASRRAPVIPTTPAADRPAAPAPAAPDPVGAEQ